MNTYELTVNGQEGTQLHLSTNYPEQVLRLLQLSGQTTPDVSAQPDTGDCGCGDVEADLVMQEQAEHDYGHDGAQDQVEFDIKDYNFKGRGDLPERLTSAKYGSNAIRSEMKESNSYEHLKAAYDQFILENDNQAGYMSPLTATDRDEFDKDPQADEDPVTDGSHSPLSSVELQTLPKMPNIPK